RPSRASARAPRWPARTSRVPARLRWPAWCPPRRRRAARVGAGLASQSRVGPIAPSTAPDGGGANDRCSHFCSRRLPTPRCIFSGFDRKYSRRVQGPRRDLNDCGTQPSVLLLSRLRHPCPVSVLSTKRRLHAPLLGSSSLRSAAFSRGSCRGGRAVARRLLVARCAPARHLGGLTPRACGR